MDYKKRIDIAFLGDKNGKKLLDIARSSGDGIDFGKLTEKDGLPYNADAVEYLISELLITYCNDDINRFRWLIDLLKKSYSVYIKKEQYKRPTAEAWYIKEEQFMEMVDSIVFLYYGPTALSDDEQNVLIAELYSKEQQVEPQQVEQIADAKNVITERAKKYFDKAIEINFMVQTTDGYKWKWGEPKGKVRLAYFLRRIYNYDGCGKIPFKGLERLFNVSGLNTSLYQLDGALPPKWIEEIDKIFND